MSNPRDDAERENQAKPAELLARFATPGAYGMLALDGFGKFPANSPESDKLVTPGELPLVATAADSGKFFHDLSPYPRSVLANVTSGSLRKDLSLYLERTDLNWLQGWGLHESASGMPRAPLGPNGKIALSNPDDHDVLAWKQPTEHAATGHPCGEPQSESGRRRCDRGNQTESACLVA